MDNRIIQIAVSTIDEFKVIVCVDSVGRAWELVAGKWRPLPALPELSALPLPQQNGDQS